MLPILAKLSASICLFSIVMTCKPLTQNVPNADSQTKVISFVEQELAVPIDGLVNYCKPIKDAINQDLAGFLKTDSSIGETNLRLLLDVKKDLDRQVFHKEFYNHVFTVLLARLLVLEYGMTDGVYLLNDPKQKELNAEDVNNLLGEACQINDPNADPGFLRWVWNGITGATQDVNQAGYAVNSDELIQQVINTFNSEKTEEFTSPLYFTFKNPDGSTFNECKKMDHTTAAEALLAISNGQREFLEPIIKALKVQLQNLCRNPSDVDLYLPRRTEVEIRSNMQASDPWLASYLFKMARLPEEVKSKIPQEYIEQTKAGYCFTMEKFENEALGAKQRAQTLYTILPLSNMFGGAVIKYGSALLAGAATGGIAAVPSCLVTGLVTSGISAGSIITADMMMFHAYQKKLQDLKTIFDGTQVQNQCGALVWDEYENTQRLASQTLFFEALSVIIPCAPNGLGALYRLGKASIRDRTLLVGGLSFAVSTEMAAVYGQRLNELVTQLKSILPSTMQSAIDAYKTDWLGQFKNSFGIELTLN